MAGRRARAEAGRRPRRRWGVFSLAALAVLGAAAWLAPAVLVHTSLRDRPLEAAFAGIDGRISSTAARWHWLSGIEYRDVVLRDAAGLPAVVVRSLVIEKGILGLVVDPRNLGTVRLAGVEAAVAVRRGGSSLEDILAPWLAAPRHSGGVTCDLELVDGTVEVIDTQRNDGWRLGEVFAAGRLLPEGGFTDWTAGGRLRHAGGTAPEPRPAEPVARPPDGPGRLDRTTIPAAAAAVLARDGGWSVSAPAGAEQAIAVTAHRLPLGGSSVLATRLGIGRVLDGLADVRLDLTLSAARGEARGRIAVERLAVCRADTLAEEFAVARCELPLHLSFTDAEIVAHELGFSSPVARGEVSGRLAWPGDDAWRWFDDCVGRDCSLAAEVDLAAVAGALPGGLVVRPEVRVTGGHLRLAAVARGDGADRILELRAEARDLAAVRTEQAGDEPAERPLRWNEPFTGWLRARRGPVGGAALRIEEGRLASTAAELSATGTPAAVRVQWTADLGGIAADLGELLDLGGTALAGTCRGRLDVERGAGGLSAGKLAASVADFELTLPGRPVWRDEAITLDGEATWSLAAGVAAIETGRGLIAARADSLEATLAGGALVDVKALLSGGGVAIRPAAGGGGVAAECSLVGDLGRWRRRLAVVLPFLATPGLELAGTVQASAAVAGAPTGGDAWRITKAGGEIERFSLALGGVRASEPRVVATAAGTLHPAAGRCEISSAELLTSSLSLRSGGVSWEAPAAARGRLDAVLAGVRGRVQWQADLTRCGRWFVVPDVADRWPVSGRAWGTLDVAQTQTGINLLLEATGSQLAIGTRPTGGDRPGPPQAVWAEPQASVTLEVTRPFERQTAGGLVAADRLVVDRLAVESSTLAVTARGTVGDWSGLRQTTLEGTVAYDWEQLSRLAAPWTAGRVRVSGTGERPFTIRAALGEKAAPQPATAAAPATAGTLALPEEWLAAVQAGAGELASGGPSVQAAASAARESAAGASKGLVPRLREVSLDTSAAWSAADIDGFSVAAGDVAIRLLEGQLAFGPFDVAAAGGRLRGAPWIRLAPLPGELVVPPGRLVERVALSGELCGRFVSLISPVLSGTTRTSGIVSVDLAGGRVPLGDPLAGEAAGQVLFEQFEVQPSGAMQPLVALLARLQAVVDPRFALGDKVVLLRVRPEPIRVRLAERRLWHEGLAMDFGQLAVTSRGSVGEDGSLAALVEVAFRGDLVGQTPVVATLLRTPIAIPLKGTLARPQFDAGAIDVVAKRIVENTARAVLDDGIGRGLEAVFGTPPRGRPPQSPAPLTLPR